MIGETVTRIRAPFMVDRDRYGNRVRDWAAADETDIEGCAVAPRQAGGVAGEETSSGRQGVLVGMTVYTPPGADVVATDRMRVRGQLFEVDGEPSDWRNPFTTLARGVEVALRRVDG